MLCIFRAPSEAKQLRYIMWTWACFVVKCCTIKRKITILSNLFKITSQRAWLHPCKASGMNSYLEPRVHCKAWCRGENSCVLWCHPCPGRCCCGPWHWTAHFGFYAGRGRVGNPWQMTKNKPQHAAFFFLLPILILSSSPWQYSGNCFQFLP